MTRFSTFAFRHILSSIINGPANFTASHHFANWQTLVFLLVAVAAELVALYVIAYGVLTLIQNIPAIISIAFRTLGGGEKDIPKSFLELTFPADTTKSAFATEQLHILLGGMAKYSGFFDKVSARKKPYSLEIVGTNDDGIRFVLMIPEREEDIVRRDLMAYLPGLKVLAIEDYTSSLSVENIQIVELRLHGDFIFPLKAHKALEEHDFMAYLTSHLAKLASDELVAFQVVTVPVYRQTHHRVIRRQQHLEQRIAQGKEVRSQIKRQRTSLGTALWLLWYPPLWFIAMMGKIVASLGSILNVFIYGYERSQRDAEKRRLDDPYNSEMSGLIKRKLDQPLFEVTLRLLVSSPRETSLSSRMQALIGSLSPFQNAYQSIGVRQHVPFLSPSRKNFTYFKLRELSPHHFSQQTILSSPELSDLYHFPNTGLTKTEGLVKSRSRVLSTPLSIKRSDSELDVVVGVNTHGGNAQPIGMSLEQRQKHTYIIGKTGTGKTTMLTNMIYQDMVSGRGLAVLDPHGDMFRELLNVVPEHRRSDVVVFDPSDREYPLGLNILNPGVEFTNEDDKHEWITSAVLSLFERLADEKQWGPRMEHILRNTVMTALQQPNPSLYTVQQLLTDKSYQRAVAKELKDPVLKQFWSKEFKLMGTMQLSNATAPLTHRLGHFITTKMSRYILLQDESTLRIADIMNEGKILLVNLSKGDIGEDQSFFFGTVLTSLVWMAAYQRTKVPERERRDFFLYVDEFQNFATKQFTDITSEGRKFHIALTASHQNIAQVEDKSILKIVAGNAHVLISLKASPDDEDFILPFMRPEVERGDIINLAPHHFYMKTTGDVSEDAFSGITKLLDVSESDDIAKDVIAKSRDQYGVPKQKVGEFLEKLLIKSVATSKKPESSVNKSEVQEQPCRTSKKSKDNGVIVHGA